MHVPSSAKIVETLYSSSRLFHQIDRGSGKNHVKKSQALIMAEDNVSIRYTRHIMVSPILWLLTSAMIWGMQTKFMSMIHPQANG